MTQIITAQDNKWISISLSKEHAKYAKEIESCFEGLNISIDSNYCRFSAMELPIQILIFLWGAIIGNWTYDLLKIGIQKVFKKFSKAKISIRDTEWTIFNIHVNNTINIIANSEKENELLSLKKLDDLILFLNNKKNKNTDKWIETTIWEVAEIVTDYVANWSFASLKENVTYLNNKDYARLIRLVDHNRNYSDDAVYVNKSSYDFLKKSKLFPNDIVISNVGEYSWTVFRVPDLKIPMTLGPNSILVKFWESNDFMYYFLRSLIGQYLINSIKSWSANPKFNKTDFKKIKLMLPSLPEQKAIAWVLASLDDKIELLREHNKTLEDIAQNIFKEWFVNFNFPWATWKMIDSELWEIPEGWRVYKLNEIIKIINWYSYKGSDLVDKSDHALVTLKSFDRNWGFQTRWFKPFIGNPKNEQEVKVGDLVVSHTDLTQDAEVLGNPAFIFENWWFSKMFITMDLVKVISNTSKISNAFLYYTMKTDNFKGHCVWYSNGTTVLHLSKKAIPEYTLALPLDFKLVEEYSELAESFTDKISINIYQIQTLSILRDELLPKLMSGEIRVNNFKSNEL